MDGFYRGIETSLLAFALLLGLAAIASSSLATGSHAETHVAVTLPMLTVTAIR